MNIGLSKDQTVKSLQKREVVWFHKKTAIFLYTKYGTFTTRVSILVVPINGTKYDFK